MLVRRQQVQQSYLVEHVSVFDAWRMSRAPVQMPGAPKFDYIGQLVTGQNRGLAMIYGAVQSQAMMISLNNIYRTLAGVMVIGVLSCMLLPRAHRKTSAIGH
jgi:hypothetical protein